MVLRKKQIDVRHAQHPSFRYIMATCFGPYGPSSGHTGAVSGAKLHVKLQLKIHGTALRNALHNILSSDLFYFCMSSENNFSKECVNSGTNVQHCWLGYGWPHGAHIKNVFTRVSNSQNYLT